MLRISEAQDWRPSVPAMDACKYRAIDLEYVNRFLVEFKPFLLLDANSCATWIPFGKDEFRKICLNALAEIPQFDLVEKLLVRGLNEWIH